MKKYEKTIKGWRNKLFSLDKLDQMHLFVRASSSKLVTLKIKQMILTKQWNKKRAKKSMIEKKAWM